MWIQPPNARGGFNQVGQFPNQFYPPQMLPQQFPRGPEAKGNQVNPPNQDGVKFYNQIQSMYLSPEFKTG